MMLVGSVCVGFSVVMQTLILISLLAERRGVRSAAETGTQMVPTGRQLHRYRARLTAGTPAVWHRSRRLVPYGA